MARLPLVDVDALPRSEYAFPGPLRDRLVAAILSGEKTATSSLLEGYQIEGESIPAAGDLEAVVDSKGVPVCVTRNLHVRVVELADVGLAHALAEGEGFTTVAQWREAHETFWHSPEVRAELGDPHYTVTDRTPIVCVSFEVVERLNALVR